MSATEVLAKPRLGVLRRIGEIVGAQKRLLGAAAACTLVLSLASLATPKLKQLGIDRGILARDTGFLTSIVWVLVGIQVIQALAGYGQAALLNWVGQQSVHNLRGRVFSHLQILGMDFYESRSPGSIISRVINDMDAVSELLSAGIVTMFADMITLVGVSFMLFHFHVGLALAIHALVVMLIITGFLFRRSIHEAFAITRETISTITSFLHESVGGMRVIQAYAQEERVSGEFRQKNIDNENANVRAAKVWAGFFPMIDILNAIGICIVFWYGGLLIMRGEITLGIAIAVILYLGQLFEPVRRLTEVFGTVQRALVAMERIFGVLDEKPSIVNSADARPLDAPIRRIAFDKVRFSYDGETEVLHEVSLTAEHGETIALVGPTGAGKSSIIKLLTRMYDIRSGRILLNDEPIQDLDIVSWRRQMAIVPQDIFLFTGTVADNIRYARSDASDEEVEAAARLAEAHEFITALPDGYQTDVHERGVKLSVGQRQLIAFARALLADPQVLILDEATSSVDHFTEVRIQQALERLLQNRIAFVIAHRLSTVVHATTILVIDNGRIIARGTHADLMLDCELYRNLYQRRFKDETFDEDFDLDGRAAPAVA